MYRLLKRNKKHIIILILVVSSFTCNGNQKSTLEKINIFYKYDEMFFYGHKEKNTFVEIGDIHEIEKVENISKNYKKVVQEYLCKIDKFIISNFNLFKEYYGWVDGFYKNNNLLNQNNNKELYLKIDAKLTEVIKNDLLNDLPEVVRGMYAIDSIQYIEAAVEIGDGLQANTLDFTLNTIDSVYWTSYLLDSQPTKHKREDVLDEEGHMKYREWFYESNLKIRIVKQIRDAEGNYCGEIYIDYYKLDEYDKLFDKDGNPKHPKEDAPEGVKNSIQ